jgi:hypothetical protein
VRNFLAKVGVPLSQKGLDKHYIVIEVFKGSYSKTGAMGTPAVACAVLEQGP